MPDGTREVLPFIEARGMAAASASQSAVSRTAPPIGLEALGGGRFRLVAPTGADAIGEFVWFADENGRVTRLVGDTYLSRVEP